MQLSLTQPTLALTLEEATPTDIATPGMHKNLQFDSPRGHIVFRSHQRIPWISESSEASLIQRTTHLDGNDGAFELLRHSQDLLSGMISTLVTRVWAELDLGLVIDFSYEGKQSVSWVLRSFLHCTQLLILIQEVRHILALNPYRLRDTSSLPD